MSNNSKMVPYKTELHCYSYNGGLIVSRKSHIVYRTAPFSMTLNDPNLYFKVWPFFDAGCLRNGQRYGHSYCGGQI